MPRTNKNDSMKESKLIETLTEFIPAFFAPDGIISQQVNYKERNLLNLHEIISQCENFFAEHEETFNKDISKCAYLITRLSGTAKRWGLSLKLDGTLDSLSYEDFKSLLIKNFGDSKEQRYALIEKLLNLKQTQLGKAADFTIKFRHLASRIEWPDNVFIDLIRRGLLMELKEEYDKETPPKNLFEATNLIIELDKKCFLKMKIEKESNLTKNNTFSNRSNKRKIQIAGSHKNFTNNKKHKFIKNDDCNNKNANILSINYTPDKSENSMVTTFYISSNGTNKIPLRVLIDSGSNKSLISSDFVRNNKISTFGLGSPIDIKLPNNKSMKITRVTKKLNLSIRDHTEKFEFHIANLQFNGIDAILGRNWLIIHKPYINFENNSIYFIGRLCENHCPSSKRNSFWTNKNVNAALIEESSCNTQDTDEEIEDLTHLINGDIIEEEICATALSSELTEIINKSKFKDILLKYYNEDIEVFDSKKADKLPLILMRLLYLI